MVIEEVIYNYRPTLTKTGRPISQKIYIEEPNANECWFFYIQESLYEKMKYMLSEGFNINTINIDGENLGHVALNTQKLKLLRFFIKHNGNRFSTDLEGETILFRVCNTCFSFRFFQTVWKNSNLSRAQLLDHEQILQRLISSDCNITKIRWLFSEHYLEQKDKSYLLKMAFNYDNNEKIIYFLQEKETLYDALTLELEKKIASEKTVKL